MKPLYIKKWLDRFPWLIYNKIAYYMGNYFLGKIYLKDLKQINFEETKISDIENKCKHFKFSNFLIKNKRDLLAENFKDYCKELKNEDI